MAYIFFRLVVQFLYTQEDARAVACIVVVMTSEPDGRELVFPSVNMPPVAALLSSSDSSVTSSDAVETTKSSSPGIGLEPPLTDRFVDAGFGSIYETIFVSVMCSCLVLPSGGYARSKKQEATLAYSTTQSELQLDRHGNFEIH
jgi:hypothetical protein